MPPAEEGPSLPHLVNNRERRDTVLLRCSVLRIYASAWNPSIFSSKIQSSWSNGAGRSVGPAGVKF
jgi:hypothetical protein